ncbi:MAG: histidine--tRNA ligase [Sphaerochaeta sp.]
MIEPKVLKGFRDSLPRQEIVRQKLMAEVRDILGSFGFVPIDTPALEYTEVLLGKGGGETDKQMFRFTDNGGRDVALRFDLTVPLARFVAANFSQLSFPFKRYHIGKVWRGEKPQKGRYREFWQCDFDILGVDNAMSDFEILLLIHTCLTRIGAGSFKVSVSHRGLLNRVLTSLGIREHNADVLRAIDKLGKIGRDGVCEILKGDGLKDDDISQILDFISIGKKDFETTLVYLEEILGDCPETERLRAILLMMKACGIEDDFVLDTSITRGLDYYTGIVYETLLTDMPQIGSICSGGRYNNLAGLYSKEKLPGVGSCIGLDRLIAALEELKSPIVTKASFADVMVVSKKDDIAWSEITAMKLRSLGVRADSYVGEKNLGQQFSYAENNGIPYVVTSCAGDKYSVKEISTRKMLEDLTIEDIVKLAND